MKYKPDRKQITWGITCFLTLVACVIFIYLVYNGRNFLQAFNTIMASLAPILFGIMIAFILNPVMKFVEKKIMAPIYRHYGIDVWSKDQKKKKMEMRKISVAITILFFVAILAAMMAIVLPQLVRSIQTIFRNLTVYEKNMLAFFDQLSKTNPQIRDQINLVITEAENALESFYNNNIAANMEDIIQQVTSQVYSIGKGIFNFIIGIIVSLYLLYTKDTLCGQGKKVAYAMFNERWANEVVGICRYINHTFVGFITGKILDSFIIGVLCFIATQFMLHTPFPVLVSFIVGFTNIIPFFGPFIGAIPCLIILVVIDPWAALKFLIFIFALQQFDGNILGPKILGGSLGLPTLWIMFAIIVGGALFGVPGMVISVPIFSVLYILVRDWINAILKKKQINIE